MGLSDLIEALGKYLERNKCDIYELTRSVFGDIRKYLGPQASIVKFVILDFKHFFKVIDEKDNIKDLLSLAYNTWHIADFPRGLEVYLEEEEEKEFDYAHELLHREVEETGISIFLHAIPYVHQCLELWELKIHPSLMSKLPAILMSITVPREILDLSDIPYPGKIGAKDYLDLLRTCYRKIIEGGGRDFTIRIGPAFTYGLGTLNAVLNFFEAFFPLALSVYSIGKVLSDLLMNAQLVEYSMHDKDFCVEIFGREKPPLYILMSANPILTETPLLIMSLARLLDIISKVAKLLSKKKDKNLLAYHYIISALAIIEIFRALDTLRERCGKIFLSSAMLQATHDIGEALDPKELDNETRGLVLTNISLHLVENLGEIRERTIASNAILLSLKLIRKTINQLEKIKKGIKKSIIPCIYKTLYLTLRKAEETKLLSIIIEKEIEEIINTLKKHDKNAKKLLKSLQKQQNL